MTDTSESGVCYAGCRRRLVITDSRNEVLVFSLLTLRWSEPAGTVPGEGWVAGPVADGLDDRRLWRTGKRSLRFGSLAGARGDSCI